MFSRNFAEFGTGRWHRRQMRHILVEFRPSYCMYTWFHHETHDWHSGCDGRNTESIELSLSEILPVNLVDRLYLLAELPATNTAYLVGFGGHRKLITIRGKLVVGSRGIWKNFPWKTVVPGGGSQGCLDKLLWGWCWRLEEFVKSVHSVQQGPLCTAVATEYYNASQQCVIRCVWKNRASLCLITLTNVNNSFTVAFSDEVQIEMV